VTLKGPEKNFGKLNDRKKKRQDSAERKTTTAQLIIANKEE
jgi:hypothetical protein